MAHRRHEGIAPFRALGASKKPKDQAWLDEVLAIVIVEMKHWVFGAASS